ncbi:DUF2220 family protein [Natroniella acetigena]|uniref:Wadjet anti-phage system protein JetD domain-containing protein n=1 Tax=Natroniella acetigena TaxID=52004 RepID=UPI00200B63F4|nr:Wadjet anti-phage system protein JetD domain-containing protein [Natroniella acetigena]MCK8826589.1 DUF2220 family protein [Natroniella acetigena]
MVKGYDRLKQLFKLFREREMKGRKRFDLAALKDFLVAELGGMSAYQEHGGYRGLYRLLMKQKEEGKIVAIKSAPLNGRNPALKTRWQLVKEVEKGWSDQLIFKLSRRLQLGYYLKRPQLQTEELAAKLNRLDKFLAKKDEREWASREERSLELFYDEKFLSEKEGKRLLSRLKLSLADIKAEKYSQMFVYWQKGSSPIRKILILENHSAFIACKRALEADFSIFSFAPDTLIFGNGKQISASLKFLNEIADLEQIRIKYAGDLDPEGLGIYIGLKEKYPNLSLELQIDYYKQMLLPAQKYALKSKQDRDETVLNKFIDQFKNKGAENVSNMIKVLWENEVRIPQEVITFEKLIDWSS